MQRIFQTRPPVNKVRTTVALLLSLFLASGCETAGQAAAGITKASAQASDAKIQAESEKANALFEEIFEQWVARSPSYQSYLGRKTNNDKWDDLSEEFAAGTHAMHQRQLAELQGLDKAQLDQATALSYELMELDLQNEIDDHRWRLYNYPVNQMFGEHTGVPSLLINQHGIDNAADAQAYIARVTALPDYFKQLIDNIKQRDEAGIVPPKFVFAHVIRDCENLIKGAPLQADAESDHALLADFKTKLAGLEDEQALSPKTQAELTAQLERALTTKLKPAYQQLISYLQQQEKTANSDAGVWKWPDGDAFFKTALQRTTTTELTAEEIHQIGLNEVSRIHDEMRAIKDQVKFEGDLKAFMQFTRTDDQFYYTGEEGKQRYLREARGLIDTMKTRLDDLFITKPKADISVKAVEAFREQSAGKAFYQRPSEDGKRPGLYYANLFDMRAMPTFQMEALAYHEGIPGHHMQLAIAQELEGVPTFRKLGGYTAYIEGWGLYSEMIPKEIGFYSDPYSDFGRLAMEIWRACRLVVDTGIHTRKWTREQGIAYYMDNAPNAESDAVKMVERHIVMPSQATAYKIGMLKLLQLREDAKVKLGEKFDIRKYHDEVLKYGPLPLNVLERIIEQWVSDQLAA